MNYLPKKYLGQHFLRDDAIIEKIVMVIRPKAADTLVEIGPGQGALTKALLTQVPKLTTIEIDHDLIPLLRRMSPERLQIYEADVLKFNFAILGNKLRIVGNLPYNISTPLCFRLLKFFPQLQDLHFMVQKEVAERITAVPGSKRFGRLSVMLQYYFDTELLFCVPREAFVPSPQVVSALIRLTPRPSASRQLTIPEEEKLEKITRLLFSTRRKMLRSHKWLNTELLGELGINPSARPEELAIGQFIKLAQAKIQLL